MPPFRHFYYNSGWQTLETRKSTSENTGPEDLEPEYQYVWSARYIDAPILRDENKNADGCCTPIHRGGDCTDAGTDERLYYLTDANMNVTCLVGTDGAAVERYLYDPYGGFTVYTGAWGWRNAPAYDNSILFCGYYRDNETGLYHVRNRYYHPMLGTWITRDRAGYVDGMSLYEYVRSSPMQYGDPNGACVCGPQIDDVLLQYMRELYLRSTVQLQSGDTGPVGGFRFLLAQGLSMDLHVAVSGVSQGDKKCPAGTPCTSTLTLCGKCIHSSQVKNMLFGFMSRMLGVDVDVAEMGAGIANRMAKGFFEGEGPTQWGSYSVGRGIANFIGNRTNSLTTQSFCNMLTSLDYGMPGEGAYHALDMASGDGQYDKTCDKCELKATRNDVDGGFLTIRWEANDGSKYEPGERLREEWTTGGRAAGQ